MSGYEPPRRCAAAPGGTGRHTLGICASELPRRNPPLTPANGVGGIGLGRRVRGVATATLTPANRVAGHTIELKRGALY